MLSQRRRSRGKGGGEKEEESGTEELKNGERIWKNAGELEKEKESERGEKIQKRKNQQTRESIRKRKNMEKDKKPERGRGI